MFKFLKKINNRIKYYKKTKYTLVTNYKKFCKNPKYKTLLYYKTEVFKPWYKENYTHTNNWEILEIVKILNKYGFIVDIIDRKINKNFIPKDKYDLFIGNAAGNSGRYYSKYTKYLTKAIKIFYAAGPNPEISNKLVEERYTYLKERNNININLIKKRTITNNGKIEESMNNTDYIFAIGNKFSFDTYKKYNKNIFRIYPSSSSKIKFDSEIIKNKNNFLYFGGNGNIVKGLDLLVETFSKTPELNLYVCAPNNEEEFNDIYKKTIEKSKNIKLQGFIKVGGKLFEEITNKCGFIILPSCSEGTATSVTTCMRAGLIPVVTREAGIDIGNFGFMINDIKIESLKKQVQEISQISDNEFKRRILDTYKESKKYTQESFSKSFEEALVEVLKENNLN